MRFENGDFNPCGQLSTRVLAIMLRYHHRFIELMSISNRCIRGLMPNLIKKSETVSINAVLLFPLYLQTFLYATFNILWLVAVVLYINLMQTTYVDIFSAFGQWHSLGCSAVKKGKKNQCQHVNSWISELRNSWNYVCHEHVYQ